MAKPDYGKLTINVTRFLINYTVRFIFAGILLYCNWVPLQELDDWFSYHVICCTIGFMPLMAEAQMLYANDELWTRQLTRKQRYSVHGILMAIGTTFIILGNLPGIYYVKPGYHLYTVHGVSGLLSMILLTLSIFLGLSVKYHDKMKTYFSFRPIWYKFLHNSVGLLGYSIGITSLCLAYFTDWFISNNSEESRIFTLILTILISLWTMHQALLSGYMQIKDIYF